MTTTPAGDTPRVFHLTTVPEWQDALAGRSITPESLGREGFVHCSTAAQLPGVVARFYADVPDLLALEIDPTRLAGAELRWEAPAHPDGTPATAAEDVDRFPHVYGPIPTDAVIGIEPVEPLTS